MSISLEKGQAISLQKESGVQLRKVIMGLGWDAKRVTKVGFFKSMFGGDDAIDLDASCVLFDEKKKKVDVVFFGHLKSNDHSIVHTGDNRTGKGDGDDEQIIVDLKKVPANVKSLVFTVNCYSGQTFDNVENAYCRLIDDSNDEEIARYTLTAQGSHTAQIMAKLYRDGTEWRMQAIGENASGRTIDHLLAQIVAHL